MFNSNMSLLEMEVEINKALKECSFWGELPITRSAYEYMCETINKVKKDGSVPATIEWLFKLYPCCTVTSMVFFIVLEYQEEFWIPWGEKIGLSLSQNHTGLAGAKMLETLKRFRMDKYEDDGYKYLTPIMCQAGVPDSQMDDIFYAITSSRRFDAHETIAEFKGWRAGSIKKSLERFIRLHEDKALNLVVLVHDVMLDGEVSDTESFEGRIFEQYSKWKEENVNRKGKFKGKGAFQENPHLIMDEDKGLCMVLPEYILEDEYCDYIKWIIESDNISLFSVECEVFNDGNNKHSLEKFVPIQAKESYTVKVVDPDNLDVEVLLKDWVVNGLTEKGYLLFDTNGKKRTDELFSYDGGTLLVAEKVENTKFIDVIETQTVYPNGEGVKAYNFIPQKSFAYIQIGSGIKLTLKRIIRAELTAGEYLFDDKESGMDYPIYTRPPEVSIEIEDGEIDHSISMVLRNRDSGYKRTVDIDNIEKKEITSEYISFGSLDAFGIEANEYGRYSVKFYVKGLYKKELEFAYVPDIEFNDGPLNLWPNEKGVVETTGFRYKIPKEAEIEFTSKVTVSTEKYNDEFWHLLKDREADEYVYGRIKIGKTNDSEEDGKDLSISFRKRVRNIQWSIRKEDDMDVELSWGREKLGIKELSSGNYWLSFSMKKPEAESGYLIVLVSSEGEDIQRVKVKPNERGKWHMDMNTFEASMSGCKLPVSLVFRSEDGSVEFPLVSVYENIIMHGLGVAKMPFKNSNGEIFQKPVLIWNPIEIDFDANNLEIVSISNCDDERIRIKKNGNRKKKDGTVVNYMILTEELKPGLYKIEYGEDDFFTFEEDGFEPPVLTMENTFYVKRKETVEKINEGTVSGLVEATTVSYKKEDTLARFCSIVKDKNYSGSAAASQLKQLIILARFGLREKNGKCEKILLELLGLIAEKLSETDRGKLLDIIIRAEIKDEEKKSLINLFNLTFAIVSSATQEEIDGIMTIDTFLGTRSVLKCPRSQWVLHSLTSGLGIDIMKEMMKKLPDGSVKVEATYNMFGTTDDFYNMFDWESMLKQRGYKLPKLDMKKKPVETFVFWSDSLVNLLIKWHFRNLGRHSDMISETEKLYLENRVDFTAAISRGDVGVKDYIRKASISRDLSSTKGTGIYALIAASARVGMLFALHDMGGIEIPEKTVAAMQEFVEKMNVIFPELIKRDILMAELFLYLKEV